MSTPEKEPVYAPVPASEEKNAAVLEEQITAQKLEQDLAKKKQRTRMIWIFVGVGVILVAGLVLGLVFGLKTYAPSENLKDCVAEGKYDASFDYFPNKLNLYVPNPNFEVKYFKNYKVITNSLDPLNVEKIVLYQCGTPKPDVKDINATLVLPVPIKSIFVGDTTSIAFLELLGVRDTIKVTDSLQYTTSPCLLAANATGNGPKLVDGYVDAAAALSATTQVDLSIDYLDSNTKKAKNYATFPATADLSAYNRISWLGFLAAFYNLESKANEIMKTMADNYNCIKSKNQAVSPKPVVAWVEHQPPSSYNFNQSVFILNRWPVYVQYTLDAGATNITTPLATVNAGANSTLAGLIGTPFRTYFTDRAAFMKVLETVDVLIDETYFFTSASIDDVLKEYGWTTADEATFKFLKNKQIWRDDKRITVGGGTDWYETAVVSANLVLNDLTVLAHNKQNVDTTYFRNIWKNGTDIVKITADMCGASGKDALSVQGLGKEFGSTPKVISCSA
ncbi:hypothetical protein HK098_000432 [Nowakowskiella sp. JEL0407]|nr:hypothetical protein HK098_000432 [Nowakowskiella sp. JEL0407]